MSRYQLVFEGDSRISDRLDRVLVIGGAGYIGSLLVRHLVARRRRVRVLDSLLFGDASMSSVVGSPNCELIVGDFRNLEVLARAMIDVDAVVHLGGIVGDPACALDEDLTIDVNLTATALLAETCKLFGISRLIFASSCSVYGQNESADLTETSATRPLSLYARTKIASEQVLAEHYSQHFRPTILRFATLFGCSYRPRFDLVVNVLSAKAVLDGEIEVFGGSQWRPFVHVRDGVKAITAALEAPLPKVGGEIYNVGSNNMNYQIVDIGKKVASLVDGTNLIIDDTQDDQRNYVVNFDKIHQTLGVDFDLTIEYGVEEIKRAYASGELKDFRSPEYSNVVQTKKFLSSFWDCKGKDQGDEIKSTHYKKTSKFILQSIEESGRDLASLA